MHGLELIGAVSCVKGGPPFVALGDAHKVVGPTQVNLGIDIGGA